MVDPTATQPRFQGGAHHQPGDTRLQLGQQGSGIALQGRPPHLPPRPALTQAGIGPQGFIQGDGQASGQSP